MTKEEIKIEAERYYTNRLNETGFELFDNERKMQISVMVSFAKLIADQESAKAVQKRDRGITDWINANKFKSNDHGIVIYPDHLIAFLQIPSVPTEPSIPISEAIKLKASCDGCEFEDKSFYDKPCVICNGFDQSIQSKL